MSLTPKQRGVLRGIVTGAAITLVVIFGSMAYGPEFFPPAAGIGERIAFALKADLVIALWLGVSIGRLARHRFISPEDIDGGGLTTGSETAKVLQAGLQNTLEQSVLAVLTHIVWAAATPAAWAATVPAAVFLFIVGRVLFLRGYAAGAPGRALGFALTFYPTMLMLVVTLFWLIRSAVT